MKRIILSNRDRIKNRIRAKVSGTQERPRLTVFKSNKFTYAQIIDDNQGKTLVQANSSEMKAKKMDAAIEVGKAVVMAAKAAGITKVVFDRNGYKYTGRILALAEAAREAGLEF
ncbi:50S ribosomal protein L18 [Candidatus Parcubacteria bacterium]|nr:50S ribosomal protein L18 [Candidatus Parcubacteria bacterium]